MLEVNEENIRNLVHVRELDMKSIDKWVSLNGNGYDIIIPTELDEYKQFIIDWLPLCPKGTETVIKDVEKKMKKIAKKNGYLLEEKHVLLMKAREIARIKREYANDYLQVPLIEIPYTISTYDKMKEFFEEHIVPIMVE